MASKPVEDMGGIVQKNYGKNGGTNYSTGRS